MVGATSARMREGFQSVVMLAMMRMTARRKTAVARP
jgi:hypothetical protein